VVNLLPNNLSEAEKEQGFELLFNGKDLSNWKVASNGEPVKKDGKSSITNLW
jgi:hypothetical protein